MHPFYKAVANLVTALLFVLSLLLESSRFAENFIVGTLSLLGVVASTCLVISSLQLWFEKDNRASVVVRIWDFLTWNLWDRWSWVTRTFSKLMFFLVLLPGGASLRWYRYLPREEYQNMSAGLMVISLALGYGVPVFWSHLRYRMYRRRKDRVHA